MNIVTDVVLPIALAFIMFSLGLGLSISDFARIFIKPKEFFVGFVSQLIILPIVALILVFIWPLYVFICVYLYICVFYLAFGEAAFFSFRYTIFWGRRAWGMDS